jgi:hypothetical protein
MGGSKNLLRMTIGFGRWGLAFRWHTRLFFLFFSLLLLPPAQLESLSQPFIGSFRKKYGLEILRRLSVNKEYQRNNKINQSHLVGRLGIRHRPQDIRREPDFSWIA